MPSSVTSVFNSPYDLEHALHNEARFSLFTTANGQFRGRLTQVELIRSRLSAVEENLPLIGFLAVPAHKVLVLLPIGDRPAPIWSGVAPLQSEFMTFGPGHRTHVRTHGPCGWGAIWLAEQDLAGYFHGLTANTLAIPAAAHRWHPRQAAGRRLRHLYTAAIRAAEVRPDTIVNAGAAHGMEQQLFDAVVDCLSAAPSDPIAQATGVHQELATQFEKLLEAQPDGRMRVRELSMRLGVSQRFLQMCCNEVLGMSPARYIRLRGLHRVHRTLNDPISGETRVSLVARHHGFCDLGRFATTYRSLFGELPSVTLRQGFHRRIDHPPFFSCNADLHDCIRHRHSA